MTNKLLIDTKPLLVLEMANNHQGDIEHGMKIVDEFHEVCKNFTDHLNVAFKFQYRATRVSPKICQRHQKRSRI